MGSQQERFRYSDGKPLTIEIEKSSESIRGPKKSGHSSRNIGSDGGDVNNTKVTTTVVTQNKMQNINKLRHPGGMGKAAALPAGESLISYLESKDGTAHRCDRRRGLALMNRAHS